MQIIGHEGPVDHALHHRVAALGDGELGLVGEGGARPAQGLGAQGEVDQHVELGDGLGADLQRPEPVAQDLQQLFVEGLLPRQGALAAAEHLILEALELGGDVALDALQGLAAHVLRGHLVGAGAPELDVIAVDAVVAHLEGGDAGARALSGLEIQQELIGVGGQGAQLIELGIVAGGDHPAVADQHRGLLDDGPREQVDHLRVLADGPVQPPEQRGRLAGLLPDQPAQARQGDEGVPQDRKVPRSCRAQGHPGQDALQVADAREYLAQGLGTGPIDQGRKHLVTGLDLGALAQGPGQPAAQQAPAHGGGGAVEHPGQGVLRAPGQGLGDLQVAAGGGVEDDGGVAGLGGQTADMRQGRELGVAHVLQQTAGGADGQRHPGAAEAAEVAGAELLAEQALAAVGVEVPGGPPGDPAIEAQVIGQRAVLADQGLGG